MSEQKKVFIDRDHFDERVRLAAGPDADEEFSADFLDGVKVVLYMLSTEPPAKVKPEAKGEWIPDREITRGFAGGRCIDVRYESWHCSYCGSVCEQTYKPAYRYCPNCGADMRGKEE